MPKLTRIEPDFREVREGDPQFREGEVTFRNFDKRVLTPLGKRVIGAVVGVPLSIASFFIVFSDGNIDALGDSAKMTAMDSDLNRREALERYQSVYNSASPAGKYVLQYEVASNVVVEQKTDSEGNGILGDFTRVNINDVEGFKINDGCLGKTVYSLGGDTTGIITGTSNPYEGGSDGRRVASSAAISDPANKDIIVIQPSSRLQRALRFKGLKEGDELRPADEGTKDLLRFYGCETGISGAIGKDGVLIAQESPWMKK